MLNVYILVQNEENIGNTKRQLAELFEEALKIIVPDEQDIEPQVAACQGKFGDYQWYDIDCEVTEIDQGFVQNLRFLF